MDISASNHKAKCKLEPHTHQTTHTMILDPAQQQQRQEVHGTPVSPAQGWLAHWVQSPLRCPCACARFLDVPKRTVPWSQNVTVLEFCVTPCVTRIDNSSGIISGSRCYIITLQIRLRLQNKEERERPCGAYLGSLSCWEQLPVWK